MIDKRSFILLHSVAFVLHATSSVFAWLCNPYPVHARLSFKVDALTYQKATNVSTVGASRDEIIYASKVSPIGLVATNETITALSHLIAIYVLVRVVKNNDYEGKDGYSINYEYMRRWAEYAVTAGLLEVAIIAGQGTREWFLIVYMIVGNVVIQGMGYLMDAAPEFEYKPWFSVFGFLLLSVQIWLIATNAANTTNASENQEVWVRLAVLYGLLYSWFGVNQTCVHYSEWYRKTFNGDMIFVFLSISAKLYLSWSLIAEIRQRFYELGEPLTPKIWFETSLDATVDTWMTIKDFMMWVSLALVVLGYVITAWLKGTLRSETCFKKCVNNQPARGRYKRFH